MYNNEKAKENRAYTIWVTYTMGLTIVMLVFIAAVTIYVDPLFHYHAPLDNFTYIMDNERYQNDGITRNFEYDSIITGTSMTENFKTSEADKIYDANFIKVPYAGGSYKEVNDNIIHAYEEGKNIKYVIRSLDFALLIMDKDAWDWKFHPTYLYDSNLFNDVNYVLNKSIFLEKVCGGGN